MESTNFWTENVLTVSGDESIRNAAKLMHEKKISSLLIVEERKPAGIITERDVVSAIGEGMDADTGRVVDVMTRDPVSIKTTENPISAKNIMLEHNFRHMPVVDENGDLVGIISLRDLIRIWLEDLVSIWEE